MQIAVGCVFDRNNNNKKKKSAHIHTQTVECTCKCTESCANRVHWPIVEFSQLSFSSLGPFIRDSVQFAFRFNLQIYFRIIEKMFRNGFVVFLNENIVFYNTGIFFDYRFN